MIQKSDLSIVDLTLLIVSISLTLVFLLMITEDYFWIVIPAILFIIFLYFSKSEVILVVVIINLLTTLTDYIGQYRLLINIISLSAVSFMFFKQYGLKASLYPKLPQSLIIFLSFLLFSISLSTVFSSEPLIGVKTILTVIVFFLLLYVLFVFLNNKKNLYFYILALCTSTFILSIRMFIDVANLGIEAYFIRNILSENLYLLSSSIYTGKVIFFISASFLLAMFFLEQFKNKFYTLIFLVLYLINMLILFLSNSRGLVLASIVASLFSLYILKRSLFIKVVLGFLILLPTVLYFYPFSENGSDLILRTGTTQREIFWQAGLELFNDHPILGVGPNQFDKYFYTYVSSDILSINEWKNGKHTPHNFFLYFAAENGILGFIVAISFFIVFFYIALKTIRFRKNANYNEYVIAVTITGIGLGFLVRSFIEVTGFLYYGFITSDLPFWLCFSILITLYIKGKERTKFDRGEL